MNIKQEVEEVLVDSIKKSFLFPFKEILGVDKIPKSIWEDSFLGGFLFSYFGESLSYFYSMASMDGESFDMEDEDFERIISTIDPNNKKLIMDNLTLHFNRRSMPGEIDPDYEENEYQRGEELAKKVLYLGYKENDVMSFDFNFDDDDEDVIFAYKKAETIHEILSNAYPGSPVVENMTRDQAASQALTHYRVFEYVKENKDRFIKSKTGIDDDSLTLREDIIDSQDYLFMKCLINKKCKRHVNMKTGKNIFGQKHWRAKDEVVNAFDLDEIVFLTGLHTDLVNSSAAKLVRMDFANTLEWQDKANNDHTFLWYLSDKGNQYLQENEVISEEKIKE